VRASLSERLAATALESGPPPPAAAARAFFDFCGCVEGAGPVAAWPADHAGRLAAAAHARDQDDLHLRSVTHPGGIVWSAVVACGLERDATWGEAVAAAALGYEVVVRLAEAAGPEHRRLWHATTTAGVAGAAAAAALLLGGDALVAPALGHALSVTSGSAQAQHERTGTLLVHRAFAASTGVACARAARAGVTANRLGLEGMRGAMGTRSVVDPADALLADRASTAIEEVGFRLHPANGFAHAAIDAALQLGVVEPAAIEAVRVTVSPPATLTIASDPAPRSDDDAWWSVEHAVATCLATGGLAARRSDRGDVLALCARTELVAGADGWSASVEVTCSDGAVATASVDEPSGHARHPASADQLRAKWRRLTGADGARFYDLLMAAEPTASLRSLVTDRLVQAAGGGSRP
jgi:2-methylcitrate dehydratase PrpD